MSEETTFFCGGCGLEYPSEELASQCADWDEKHPDEPNSTIVAHAMVKNESEELL